MSVAGVVLAAGRSERMGSPKPLLLYRGRTFLATIAETLRRAGAAPLHAVVAEGDRAVADEARRAGLEPLPNPAPERGMIASLALAIVHLEPLPVDGLLLWPVDHPAVAGPTVRALLEGFARSRAPVVTPVHQGRRGHPVLFSRATFGELARAPAGTGARAVVAAHAADLALLEVDDPGILADIDTPDDLARL